MESLTHVCLFLEKPLVDRFCLVSRQTQRCKVYVVAELRAPTTDLCDLVCLWI